MDLLPCNADVNQKIYCHAKICVENLSAFITPGMIYETFRPYGRIVGMSMNSCRSVTLKFAHERGAQAAMFLDGDYLNGKRLIVKRVVHRREREANGHETVRKIAVVVPPNCKTYNIDIIKKNFEEVGYKTYFRYVAPNFPVFEAVNSLIYSGWYFVYVIGRQTFFHYYVDHIIKYPWEPLALTLDRLRELIVQRIA